MHVIILITNINKIIIIIPITNITRHNDKTCNGCYVILYLFQLHTLSHYIIFTLPLTSISEMTYYVSSGMLNSTHSLPVMVLFLLNDVSFPNGLPTENDTTCITYCLKIVTSKRQVQKQLHLINTGSMSISVLNFTIILTIPFHSSNTYHHHFWLSVWRHSQPAVVVVQ